MDDALLVGMMPDEFIMEKACFAADLEGQMHLMVLSFGGPEGPHSNETLETAVS